MRIPTLLITLSGAALRLAGAQAAPPAEVAAIDSIARVARALGRAHGESVWPGFRPDTIPVAFVLPSRGTLPAGFSAVTDDLAWRPEAALGASNTSVVIGGRSAAQVVVPRSRIDGAELASLVFHEA